MGFIFMVMMPSVSVMNSISLTFTSPRIRLRTFSRRLRTLSEMTGIRTFARGWRTLMLTLRRSARIMLVAFCARLILSSSSLSMADSSASGIMT